MKSQLDKHLKISSTNVLGNPNRFSYGITAKTPFWKLNFFFFFESVERNRKSKASKAIDLAQDSSVCE